MAVVEELDSLFKADDDDQADDDSGDVYQKILPRMDGLVGACTSSIGAAISRVTGACVSAGPAPCGSSAGTCRTSGSVGSAMQGFLVSWRLAYPMRRATALLPNASAFDVASWPELRPD